MCTFTKSIVKLGMNICEVKLKNFIIRLRTEIISKINSKLKMNFSKIIT